MATQTFDPGLTQKFTGSIRRTINKDGSFNVRKTGVHTNPYLYMISISWPRFFALVFLGYLVANCMFASAYLMIGIEHLKGAEPQKTGGDFLSAFFFSTHTLTTVGYGNIAPDGLAASALASLEALTGLMSFALATGLLYGRFSRPSARIRFSDSMVISPFENGQAAMFRLANERANVLMDLDATVMLMTVEPDSDGLKRVYKPLKLQLPHIYFLPLTWTLVHAIDKDSPLYGKTPEDLKREQAEFLILIRSFDDTFSQTVHARHSYRFDEIDWDFRFLPAFEVDRDGDLILHLDKLSENQPVASLVQ